MKLTDKRKYSQKWHNINWNKVSKFVSDLQIELVVAYKNNDKKLLFDLQEKLIMSFEGRAMAVRRIVSNNGKETAGLDKILWNSPTAKMQAITELRAILIRKSGEYEAGPVRRTWIPKDNSDEMRPLGISNMIDRGLQALILLPLDPIVEEMCDNYSFGFRKFRSTADAIQRIRTMLDKPKSPRWIWDADIEKCFDNISHEFLEKEINCITCPKAEEYVLKWLKAPIIEKGIKTFPKRGTPQGAIISPLLCNMSLNGLENAVREGMPSPNSTAGKKLKGSWVMRYADDFIVTSNCKEKLLGKHVPQVTSFLSERGLNISEKKSRIINLEFEELNFLGWNISLKKRDLRKNQYKKSDKILIIKPSKKSIKRFKKRIKDKFRLNKPIRALIKDLNPILRGWTNYYRDSYHSQEVFQSISHYIYQLWWKWAQKKHPSRNKNWLYERYIFKTAKNSWRIGESKEILLFDVIQTKQLKVKNLRNKVNPYIDEEYYINRTIIREADNFREAIYKKYNFKCYVCNKALYGSEEIHLHHLISRKEGGEYTLKNIVPVHSVCHEGITHAKKS